MSELHSAAGSYAVDALSPAERGEFEAHLAGCASCRHEVAEFTETLADLAPLAAATPPASLRMKVLATAAAGQQLGPRLAARSRSGDSLVAEDRPEVAPRRALPAQVTELRPLGPDEVAPLEEHPSVLPDEPWLNVTAALREDTDGSQEDTDGAREDGDGRRGRRRDRLLGALVAAALVMALALTGWVYVSWEQSQARVAQAQQETELLTAPDAELYVSDVNGAQVSYVVSRERDEALFLSHELPVPGPGQVYQVWVLRDGATTPGGTFREGGDVRQGIAPLGDADGLALSVEPSRGSAKPTTDVVGKVDFSP